MCKSRVPKAGAAQPCAGQFHSAETRNRAQRRFPVGRKVSGMAD